jgi:hypothetical protein
MAVVALTVKHSAACVNAAIGLTLGLSIVDLNE